MCLEEKLEIPITFVPRFDPTDDLIHNLRHLRRANHYVIEMLIFFFISYQAGIQLDDITKMM